METLDLREKGGMRGGEAQTSDRRLFILFHKRVCGPLANSLFQHQPVDRSPKPAKIERAYHQADAAVQRLIDLLAA